MSRTEPKHLPPASATSDAPVEAPVAVHLVEGRGAEGQILDERYLLRTEGGRYLKMPPSTYHLLRSREEGASFEDIAAAMSRKEGDEAVLPEEVERAHQRIVATLRAIEERDSLTRSGFWLRWPLLPEALVARIVPALGALFRPWPLFALLGAMAVVGVLFSRMSISLDLGHTTLFGGYVLLVISLIFHELGHASACAYFGARPRAIGFGVYLVYPVFYSDVSAAWELPRKERVVVDLAGLYFQCVLGALYVVLYLGSGWEPLLAAVLMIAGSSLFSLNPIFKFDGYWMIADALGVHNLSQQPGRFVRHFWQRLRGGEVEPLPFKPWVVGVLCVYSVLSFAVWGIFLYFFFPFLGERILAYPATLLDFLRALWAGESGIVGEFAAATYLFLLAALILGRMALAWGRDLVAWALRIASSARLALAGWWKKSGATP